LLSLLLNDRLSFSFSLQQTDHRITLITALDEAHNLALSIYDNF
jgi:hypothetical protein